MTITLTLHNPELLALGVLVGLVLGILGLNLLYYWLGP